MSREVVRDVAQACVVTLVIAAVMLSCGGCAGALRVKARPLESPCLSTLPTRAKLVSVAEPERFAYLDNDGEPRAGLKLSVDVQKMAAFLGYVDALQAIAERALGCLRR